MQRFKKELLLKKSYVQEPFGGYWHAPMFGRTPMANWCGKFVYSANGTLTQAARWRAKAMWLLCGDDEQNIRSAAFGFAAEDHLWAAKQLLQSSREGGCRLPR